MNIQKAHGGEDLGVAPRSNMAALIGVLLLSGCAHQDEWTKRDTMMQLAASTTIAYDAYLTTKLQYQPGWYEDGPIAKYVLGAQPSTSDTYWFFGTQIVSSYLIARALPAKWRPYWQGAEITVHSLAINTHCTGDECFSQPLE